MNSCYLIGAGTLLKECINILQQFHFKILGVFADDSKITTFCQEENIQVLSLNSYQHIKETGCDYLFSIVNPVVLPVEIFSYVNKMAVNYHDSLLPKYAGVNASPWAILNGEQQHGISWHQIESGIDTGEILLQKTLTISEDETTVSLNLRCYAAAIETFPLLIEKIINDTIESHPQCLANRSFYRFKSKPQGNGFLDWNASTKCINRLIRGLSFGDTDNTLTTAKIIINKQIYVINDYSTAIYNHGTNPGTIISVNKQCLKVATSDGYLDILSLKDLNNKLITIETLLEFHSPEKINIKVLPSSVLTDIQSFSQDIAGCEKFWYKEIKSIDKSSALVISTKEQKYQETLLWERKFKTISDLKTIKALISLYFYRINNYRAITIKLLSYIRNDYFTVPIMLPLNLDFNQRLINLETIIEKLDKLTKHKIYDVDLFSRYPNLENNLPDCPILIDDNLEESEFKNINHYGLYIRLALKQGVMNISCYQNNCILSSNMKFLCQTMPEHLNKLAMALEDTDQLISTNILSQYELATLKTFNNQHEESHSEKTVLQEFLQQYKENPDNKAIVEGDNYYTYSQVATISNALAHQLREIYQQHFNKILDTQKTIAIHCESAANYIFAALACLRIGCIFTPVDPQYPIKRRSYIFKDSEAVFILTDMDLILKDDHNNLIVTVAADELLKSPKMVELNQSRNHDLIYLMYTSGSTGQPKGVLVRQTSFINLLNWYCDLCLCASDKTYVLTSLSFDLTQKNIFGPLMVGGEVHFRSDKLIYDANEISNYVAYNNITHINCPTNAFLPLIGTVDLVKRFSSLKNLVLGANLFNGKVLHELALQNPKLKIYNSYGPAECTDVCACYKIEMEDIQENRIIPMNPPIANTEIFILDRYHQQCPLGLVGDLYVTGQAISEGYLNKPEITKRVFLKNNISLSKYKGTMYHTGDRALLDKNGRLVFVNRDDKQIKIRGFRVELGEIESSLNHIDGVFNSSVLVRGQFEKQYIYGFVVLTQGNSQKLTKDIIYEKLKEELPNYMLPHDVIIIDKIPLTVHGKVEHAELLKLIATLKKDQDNVREPTNEIQTQLCKLWSTLLDSEINSIECDFFHTGGDSLLSVKLISKIEIEFGIKLKVIDIYRHPTLENLATIIEAKLVQTKNNYKSHSRDYVNDTKQLISEQQKTILLVNKTHPEYASLYNSAYCFSIEGHIDIKRLQLALVSIYDRFKILRENYHIDPNLKITKHYNDTPLEINVVHCQEHEVPILIHNNKLDISKDKLFIVEIFVISNEKLKLVIHGHHCLTDAESLTILCDYLSKSYDALTKGNSLPNLDNYIDYDEYIIWQKQYFQSEEYKQLLTDYAKNVVDFKPLTLPYDHLPLNSFKITSRCHYFKLDNSNFHNINEFCKKHRVSYFSLLWAVVSLQIHNYVNKNKIYAGNYVANRYPHRFADTVGFFATMFIIKADINKGKTFIEFVKQIHEQLISNMELHHIPVKAMFKELKVQNQANVTTLVPLGIEYINNNQLSNLKLGNSQIKPEIIDYGNGKFNLSFRFFQLDPVKFNCAIEYNTQLFEQESIELIINDFKQLMKEVLQQADITLDNIPMSVANKLIIGNKLQRHEYIEYKGLLINLNEISQNIARVMPVKECLCVYRQKQFVLLYVADKQLNEKTLKKQLATHLPYNVTIHKFVRVNNLPHHEELVNADFDDLVVHLTVLPPNKSIDKNENKSIIEQVATIWQHCLGIDEIDYNTDFFELGGESMLAIDILRMIDKDFGIALDIQDFFQQPTIQGLSDIIEKENTEHDRSSKLNKHQNGIINDKSTLELCTYQPIIEFQIHHGARKNIFCVHPLLNNGHIYRYFSQCFNPEVQFISINSYNYYHKNKISDVALLASLYNHQLLKKQPNGPYYLMGWSYGGMIAYEMAQQLSQKGMNVNGLYLIDSFVLPENIKVNFKQLTNYFGRIGREIYSIKPQGAIESAHFNELLEIELAMMMDYYYQPTQNKVTLFKAKDAFTHFAHITDEEQLHFDIFQNYLLSQPQSGYQPLIRQLKTIELATNHHFVLNNNFGQKIADFVSHDLLAEKLVAYQ